MWTKIKAWFKKDKQKDVVDRVEPTYQLPVKQRVGKAAPPAPRSPSGYSQSPASTYVPPTQSNTIHESFQDVALTYLVLDSLNSHSQSNAVHESKSEPVSAPEPTQSYSNEPSTSSSYSDSSSSSRYDSSDYSGSSYSSSSDSGSSYSSDSGSSSSYSSD